MSAIFGIIWKIGNELKMKLSFIACIFFVTLSAHGQAYIPNADAKVNFKIKNFGSTVDGSFTGLTGTLEFNENDFAGTKFKVSLDAKSIDTGIGMRDNHLRKSDYFDVSRFPVIEFSSTKVVKGNASEGIVTGKLTIKNITKEITFPFTFAISNGNPRFKGEFKLNRRDYAVGGSSISLADELMVILDVPFKKP